MYPDSYQNILVAIDLSAESEQVLKRAKQIAEITGADTTVLAIVEPINETYAAGLGEGFLSLDLSQIESQAQQRSADKLQQLVDQSGLSCKETRVAIGYPNEEIKFYASQNGTDLIILGSHGRHGIQLLLGSTANAVLHGATCDVLAVRIKPD